MCLVLVHEMRRNFRLTFTVYSFGKNYVLHRRPRCVEIHYHATLFYYAH